MTADTTPTRRIPTPRPTWSVLLAAVALVAAACGGGGGSPATNGNGGASPAAAGFCKTAAAFAAELEKTDMGSDERVERYLETFDALVAQAPDELEEDLAVIQDFNRKLAAMLEGDQSVQITDADQAAFEAAATRLDAYLTQTCGFDMESSEEEEYAGEPGALGTQTGTLELSGLADVNAEYAALEVNCDYTGEQLYVDMVPADDGWATSFVVDGLGELRPGTYENVLFQISPPYDSSLSDEGVFLDATSGTVTLEEVGKPFQQDQLTLVSVTGSYRTDALVNQVDGSPAGSAQGTFRCEAYLSGGDAAGEVRGER